MYVLGLNTAFHDTSACLVKDGRIVVAIEEERLSRTKHSTRYPMGAIRYCLDAAGIGMSDVDLIVSDLFEPEEGMEDAWMNELLITGERPRAVKLRHHLGHAAAAFYASGFEDAAILTTDGGGSRGIYDSLFHSNRVRERQVFWRGTGLDIWEISTMGSPEPGEEQPYPPSIAHVYEMASTLLGFNILEGPGKIMGLASYGSGQLKRELMEHYIQYPNGHWIYKHRTLGYEDYSRPESGEFLPKHAELAYMIQQETERAMVSMAHHLYRITRSKNLCIGGGVGLNCVANRKILDETPFEKVYLFPACSDSGLAVGNALYGYYKILKGDSSIVSLPHPYLGKSYAKSEIEESILAYQDQLEVHYYEDSPTYVQVVAEAIHEGKIVAWFYEGSEIGPRALGHRSILADARRPEMKDVLNYRVKHREPFRPFAPSVLLEHASLYFELSQPSPYMLMVAEVKESGRSLLPSITHVDGTARVQTLTREENGLYYDLVSRFHDLTGVPVILNTSFNVAGEPIVEKPAEAIRCFLSTDIDLLAMDHFILKKKTS